MPHDTATPNTVDRLLDAVPAALAMMAAIDLGVFTILAGGVATRL